MKPPITISQLPEPPIGKSGWPWTVASKDFTHSDTPRISVVIPTFNQGNFIEETIRSILLQGYQNTELIVIDGGSRDNTVDILKRYSAWIDFWESKPDRGQSDAINKGMAKATGCLVNWLNSDDYLEPNFFSLLANLSSDHPTPKMFYFGTRIFNDRNREVSHVQMPRVDLSLPEMLSNDWGYQPSIYFRSDAFRELLPVCEHLHYSMDVELRMRCLAKDGIHSVFVTEEVASNYRLHDFSKTVSQRKGFFLDNMDLAFHLATQSKQTDATQLIEELRSDSIHSTAPQQFKMLTAEVAYESSLRLVARCLLDHFHDKQDFLRIKIAVQRRQDNKFARDLVREFPVLLKIAAKPYFLYKLGQKIRKPKFRV